MQIIVSGFPRRSVLPRKAQALRRIEARRVHLRGILDHLAADGGNKFPVPADEFLQFVPPHLVVEGFLRRGHHGSAAAIEAVPFVELHITSELGLAQGRVFGCRADDTDQRQGRSPVPARRQRLHDELEHFGNLVFEEESQFGLLEKVTFIRSLRSS